MFKFYNFVVIIFLANFADVLTVGSAAVLEKIEKDQAHARQVEEENCTDTDPSTDFEGVNRRLNRIWIIFAHFRQTDALYQSSHEEKQQHNLKEQT